MANKNPTSTKPAATKGRSDLTAKVHNSTKGAGKISAYALAAEHGISASTLLSRITKGGLSVKEAATKPSAGNWRTKLKAQQASKPAKPTAKKTLTVTTKA